MISIHPFDQKHLSALAVLMLEMTRFYGATVSGEMNVENSILEQSRNMDMLLAFQGETLTGFASFKTLFPVGGLLSFTHIQQIYVATDARRHGVAQRLMVGVADMARSRGCQWIEWATRADNTDARAFYDRLGAKSSAKIHYVLKGAALEKLASGENKVISGE